MDKYCRAIGEGPRFIATLTCISQRQGDGPDGALVSTFVESRVGATTSQQHPTHATLPTKDDLNHPRCLEAADE